jgi:hypothetical protein
MPVSRPTLSTVGVTVALAALIVGIVVSIDESHHHRNSTPPSTSGLVQVPASARAQQFELAHELNKVRLPKDVVHTTTCPQAASVADACFFAPLHRPVPPKKSPGPDIRALLTSLHITLAGLPAVPCTKVPGGTLGMGYNCTTIGTWGGADGNSRQVPVSVVAFVSDAAHKYPDRHGIDLLVSVQPAPLS